MPEIFVSLLVGASEKLCFRVNVLILLNVTVELDEK